MKKSRFTTQQIIGILKQHEAGIKAPELARKHGITEATPYRWKATWGGMTMSDAVKLKQLEDENRRLKHLVEMTPSSGSTRPAPASAIPTRATERPHSDVKEPCAGRCGEKRPSVIATRPPRSSRGSSPAAAVALPNPAASKLLE